LNQRLTARLGAVQTGVCAVAYLVSRATRIYLTIGGEGEIRTHETCEGPPVFKTGAFNRSATSPVISARLATRRKILPDLEAARPFARERRPNCPYGGGLAVKKSARNRNFGGGDIDSARTTLR
jgi:hypothetical protein